MEKYLKAIVAALIPVLNACLLWAVTGEINAPELATALSGLIVALLVYLVPNVREDKLSAKQLDAAARDHDKRETARLQRMRGLTGNK